MPNNQLLSSLELEQLDRFYREGGLRHMASPHIHYHDATCPHPGCQHKMEWIDFQLELCGDAEGIYKPLVRSWWEGIGFVGRCPNCGEWIRFTTLGMEALSEEQAGQFPKLPENWHCPDSEEQSPLSEVLHDDLDRRLIALEANRSDVVPWEEIEARARARFRERPKPGGI